MAKYNWKIDSTMVSSFKITFFHTNWQYRESGFLWVGAVSLVPADSTWAGLAVLCFPGVPNHSLYFTLYTSTHVCVDMYMILMIWLNKIELNILTLF